ncbi:MAG: ATP synthase F1 subunit delta [Pirellulales bacterium]|nr:ATP synthase F1 subunit delta [Pirellulales bacterium]
MAKTITNSKQTSADIVHKQVARVYALALVDAAVLAGIDETILSEFAEFVDHVLDRHAEFEAFLGSALISIDEKASVLDRILSNRISPLLLSFLKVVGRHDRFNCLRTIRHEAVREYHRRHGKMEVELCVALEPSDALTSEICQMLCGAIGVEPILDTVIDPALLGGFTLTVGDTIYDGSVRTQFRGTRESIIQQTIHMIQAQRTTR